MQPGAHRGGRQPAVPDQDELPAAPLGAARRDQFGAGRERLQALGPGGPAEEGQHPVPVHAGLLVEVPSGQGTRPGQPGLDDRAGVPPDRGAVITSAS